MDARTPPQSSSKQLSLVVAPPGGAVQLRTKNLQSSGDRLSQSKSMVLQEADLQHKAVRPRRKLRPAGGAALPLTSLVPDVGAPQESVPARRPAWSRRRSRWGACGESLILTAAP